MPFLQFQVRNIALELSTGAGITGEDLDAATTAGGGAAITPLLVGWLQSAGTPAADLARSAMEGQALAEPKAVVFPTLALAAFLADATRIGATTSAGAVAEAQFTLLGASTGGDFCSQVSAYLDQTLRDVLD